ncbi:histidine kinase [Emticicia sp. W12TSBA100-4]|uniref:sensor histidine kinase n=1 Tax=Emticicia sp. W12TSBA100-4 TaxID=3160965 RepID=UPI003305C576
MINKNAEISAALLQGQTIERKRVAADLHDNLGSTMSSLIWTMDAIDANKLATEEKDVYQNLKKMLSNAYDEVRLLSHNLLPEEFEKQGLTAALQYFVRKVNQNSSIKFNLQIDDNFGKLDKKVEFELYSICLELINNIIKHSKATEARIKLSRTENQVKLLIADNGIGTFKNESDGKGMKNVKARVDSLNGTWEVSTLQNQGFINEIAVNV